ncbi:hypothetical protein OUHCRE20_44780 [Enterobacter hormaechei subsp. steigerwaltii]|jgi:hypothetical protein|uniref:Uncharacterized protein n=2 Tax=Enterobacteriaceae TaxID=543 RepID=A0ABD0BN62_ENTCL|nr:hypothetical protein [Veillonella sp.]KTQ48847.1 hypothetical protein NS23R_21815 [Enterobacter hormaechei]BCZ55226.1 hypothetical protein SL264_46320 [Enterobacter cloacae]BCZ64856.1 hypothetical protein SL269_46400 [Klebsiella aerogenes]MDU3383524.1 hypothetical protein [Veillonella sp.]BDK27967.1 hypothetical protein FJMB80063_46460 [Enterobacter hormaechei]
MIRPIQVRRAIDEYKWVFWDLNHNVRAFYEFMGKGCHRRMKTSGFSALYRKRFCDREDRSQNKTVDKFVHIFNTGE